jgi:hypothetical protein
MPPFEVKLSADVIAKLQAPDVWRSEAEQTNDNHMPPRCLPLLQLQATLLCTTLQISRQQKSPAFAGLWLEGHHYDKNEVEKRGGSNRRQQGFG